MILYAALALPLKYLSSLSALLALTITVSAADSVIVFNEIQYHPANEATETEWIELRSLQGVDVDLSGWKIEGGIDYRFPDGTVMQGGSFLVVAKTPGALPGSTGPWIGQLDNGGEEIRLVNRSGRVMDVLDYGDSGGWPIGADGSGATLARRNSLRAADGAAAWAASNELGGTPGAANFLDAAATSKASVPIPITSTWKYDASGVAPAANWKDIAFNDSAWASGPGLLYNGTAKLADPIAPTTALGDAGVGLSGWWRFEELSGMTASNSAAGGTPGSLVGADVGFVADGTRGRVLRANITAGGANGSGSYVSAGTLPTMTLSNNFTWAFWSRTTVGSGTQVMVGNRYKPGGGDFSPREFIKFTNNSLEFHRNGAGEDIDYADLTGASGAPGPWVHHAVVKTGATLTYYRNGVSTISRAITQAQNNPQPFFFGADGNAGAQEAWSGYLDDVATWTRALPADAIDGLFKGTYTPGTAPTATVTTGGTPPIPAAVVFPQATTTPLTDDFAPAAIDAGKWTVINRGLESSANGGFAAPTAGGQLTLGGTTSVSLWAGKSLESVARFSTRSKVTFTVDRVSLSGTGTGRRSSIWLYGDSGHYLHYAQSPAENGWQYHSNDVGGSGTNLPTGAGVNLSALDGVDLETGACTMQIVFTPGTYTGQGTIEMYRNGVFAGSQSVTNWPANFAVVLTGEARQAGDTVTAVFDNASVSQVTTHPLQTDVGALPSTAYFRKTFSFPGNTAGATLQLWPIADDGVVYYLNGVEVYRQSMPAGVPTHATPANGEVVDASFPATIVNIPTTQLIRGTNVLSAEVHQFSPNGGDLVFGGQLHATEVPGPPADTIPGLVFNEFAPGTDATWQLELANLGGTSVNLADYRIRSSTGQSFTLSGTLAAGALLTLDNTQIGFHPLDGQRLFLVNAAAGGLADARQVTNSLRGRTSTGEWGRPSGATFGSSNAFTLNTQIVINEIMYNLPNSSPEQWVELYNRGASPVDLSGWQFSEGISFTFPAGAVIGAGEYAIVAWNVSSFNTLHPGVPRVFGPFTGSLSGRGERLRLEDANQNVANEVTYFTRGRWPEFADGGGSSLELRNPAMDNSVGEAWSASNEVPNSSWTNVSYTFSGANLENNPTYWNELVVGLVDGGEVLIDDIQVNEDPTGTNVPLILNGTFTGGTTGWRLLGNHSTSTVVDDPSAPGNKVLKIAASGYTEHMSNHLETTLQSGGTIPWTIKSGSTYRISYRARWAGGSNRLHTRLYFNRGARQELLPRPATGGTPGAQNSRFVVNAGPTYRELTHNPAVPPAGQAATVSVKVDDPNNVAGATLFYSVNGNGFISTPMTLSGGRYNGVVPQQSTGAKVQFYVQAVDGAGATSTFPAAGVDSRAVIPWQDGQAMLTLPSGAKPHNVRIVMTPADVTKLHLATNVMSNQFIPCTIIYDERDIYYHCGVHLKGSEHGRAKDPRVGFRIEFPPDAPFLDRHTEISIDRSGAGDQFSQKEILVKKTLSRAGGFASSEDDLCRVIAPKSQHTSSAILIKTKLDSNEFLDAQFENGSDGTLFEYELIYALETTETGDPQGLKVTSDGFAAGVGIRAVNPGATKEEYRWYHLIKNNRSQDNYQPLVNALTALGQSASPTFHTQTAQLLNIDGWLRGFSGPVAWSVGDNYGMGSGHNALFYLRPDGRVQYIPWDMDFTASSGATAGIVSNGELSKLVNLPANKRAYYGHLLDVCNTSFNTSYLTPWAQHYSKFLSEDLTSFMSFVSQREASIRSQVASGIPNVAFAITTNGGAPFTVAANSTTLAGTGWVNIREFRRMDTGLVLPTTWVADTTWNVTVALNAGANPITLGAYDYQGNLIATRSITITNTLTPPAPKDYLRITELHYNPAAPTTAAELAASADNNDFEFIELTNTANATLDISGCEFTEGVDYKFPANTNLAAGERIIVVRNLAAFRARYGPSPRVATGAYGPNDALSNSGELILLVDATGADIERFSYGEAAPWPNSADGLGFSLVRRNPAIVATSTYNWRSSVAIGGTPGGTDNTTFMGNPNADDNGDGINNLLQYAMGGSIPVTMPVGTLENGYLVFRHRRNLAADDVTFAVERNLGLPASPWNAGMGDVIFVSEINHGNGTATQTWRSANPVNATGPDEFIRLRVTKP